MPQQMTPEVFRQLAEDAHKELRQHHLHDAIYIISLLLQDQGLVQDYNDCQEIATMYHKRLQTLASGEPGTEKMQKELDGGLIALYGQLAKAERSFCLQNESTLYTTFCKAIAERGETMKDAAEQLLACQVNTPEREAALDTLFYHLWASDIFCLEEVQYLYSIVGELTETELCMVITALTLALQDFFDLWKVLALINLQDFSKSTKAKVRAIAGLVLSIQRHDKDLCAVALAMEFLQHLFDSTDAQVILAHLNQSQLICLQADTASKKIRQVIIPKLLEAVKDRHLEMGFDEDNDEQSIDLTQELQKPFSDKMRSGLKELVSIHLDGIDVNAPNMKAMSTLPFFKEFSHWLLPFDPQRSEIKDIYSCDPVIRLLFSQISSSICDTEAYGMSFIFLRAFKEATLEIKGPSAEEVEEGLGMTIDEFLAQQKEEPNLHRHCLNYMQQLYRFFKHSPYGSEWNDPFRFNLNWLENPLLGPILQKNEEMLTILAGYLLKYQQYKEADAYYSALIKLNGADAGILRRAGSCKQELGHFASALNLYTQSDILEPENTHTLAQMQACYNQLDKQEQRLECLLQLERLQPENDKIISQTGLCLIQLERWQDALQRFFHLELEGKYVAPSWRAIGWCSLNQGKHEQARKYYEKLINSTSVRWQDFLNAGHAAWLQGNVQQAIEYYRQYIKHYLSAEPNAKNALAPYLEDNALLLRLGKSQQDIDLMHDLLEE